MISTGSANKIKTCCFSFLLFSIASFSQSENTKGLIQQFEQYQVNNLQEKLFVHTDKTFYLAGEIIWFKIYALDGMLNKPLEISKVVYVEILDRQMKTVLQTKISMEDASGNGFFLIPASIVSGNYKLRAYTKWMKNFTADFFYEQVLTIINTSKSNQSIDIKPNKNYDVQFFPEGGNLVYGLQSKLAFKAVNKNGNAVNCSGFIINQKNDTVINFATLKFGIGSLVFTPKKDEYYRAVINLPDTTITKQITGILTQGYTMTVENEGKDFLKVIIRKNDNSLNSSVYLFAHTRHLVKSVQQGYFSGNEAFFLIDKSILEDGISHLTIFNTDKKPVCERLYFKKPQKKLDIQLTADKIEYTTRDKVNIELHTYDYSGKSLQTDMSISVFKIDSLQTAEYNHINSYLMLSSELTGKIDTPDYYFENTEAAQAADNLMLTQGWRRFTWDSVLKSKKPFFKFIPEIEGHVIDGRVTDKITGNSVANVSSYLSIPEYNYAFKTSTSRENGNVAFTFKSIYGINDIVLQANNGASGIYKIEINNPFTDKFSLLPLPVFSLTERWKNELTERSINVQVENAYLSDKKFHSFSLPIPDSIAFYGIPDRSYYLDDFTRFVTMDEVFKEFIPDVRVRKQSSGFQFRVLNAPLKSFFDRPPLILADGVPLFNTDKIMAVDPLKIKKIEVTERRYFLGNQAFDGIVNLITYQGDLGGYELDPAAIILEYEGLQQQRKFYSPAYESDEQITKRIPDFRNQLCWFPKIKTNPDNKTMLSFYTSDLMGRFIIITQGITKEGLANSNAIFFNVKAPKAPGKGSQ
jgi:hypothetical protein